MMATLVEAAKQVLSESSKSMHVRDIWSAIHAAGAAETSGKTPEQSLATELLRRTLGVVLTSSSKEKLFFKESPNTFGLLEWLDADRLAELEVEESAQLAAGGTQQPGEPYDVAAYIERQDPLRLKTRRDAAEKARGIIEGNLGSLSEKQLRELFHLLNTDYNRDRVRTDRYGLAFTGALANKIVADLGLVNRCIRRLWEADGDDSYAALDEFYEAKVPGAGRSLPTVLLHLKSTGEYFPLMSRLAQGYVALTGRDLPRGRTSAKYREYVEGIRELRKLHDIPPELIDGLLATAGRSRDETKPDTTADFEFQGFSDATFQFLRELESNNRQDWFRKNKPRFKQHLDRPLRALVEDLGARYIGPLNPELEVEASSRKTISLIRKNIHGKREEDCYNPHYWAAFYRAHKSKTTDFQLFVHVHPDRCECGFYIGDRADEARASLVAAIRAHPKLAEEFLAEVDARDDIQILEEAGEQGQRGRAVLIRTADDLAKAFETGRPRVVRTFEADDPLLRTSALVDEVWSTLRAVYPLFLLGTSESPEQAIDTFRSGTVEPPGDAGAEPQDAYSRADLLRETYLDEATMRDMESLLFDKRQIIFHGPPGTGKTFIAERFGRYLAGEQGDVKIVQFHPSYAYEDFVEGIRPSSGSDGRLEFKVQDGIFKRFCETARQRKGRFVLIVDEINRGNLPRIFGELMYLLENRGRKVDLPYSKKPFSIPDNVYVIGTMNSADHSIALVDFALRRRFHFMYFEPLADVLTAWLKKHHPTMAFVGQALERLNKRLLDAGVERELLVGHSHFMRPELSEDRLRLIWQHTVEPLLEEYFYGRADKLDEFRYDAFFDALSVEQVEDEDVAIVHEAGSADDAAD